MDEVAARANASAEAGTARSDMDGANAHSELPILRFLTCGSVDDGKSTLIGRMLYEAQLIFEDQVAALMNESRHHGTQGGDIDFALLVDGLAAEREQGITIDVAYRYFATPKRKFIIADTPGHIQYTHDGSETITDSFTFTASDEDGGSTSHTNLGEKTGRGSGSSGQRSVLVQAHLDGCCWACM